MTIYSCKGCVPPKRYPGCHGECANYLAEKANYDALKAKDNEKKAVEQGIYRQRSDKVYQAIKNRRKKG
jgi:hypothetical protein